MATVALSLAAAAAFNLLCSGTQTTTAFDGTSSKPYSSEYRIDLNQAEWCEDDCRATHAIAKVLPTQLQLEVKDTTGLTGRTSIRNFIDRETGGHWISATMAEPRRPAMTIVVEWKGACEKRPFSGFPVLETKF